MRGKDFSTGLRGGLFEQRHCVRMGASIWLYGWLVLRQTSQHDGVGWVLGGSPITYREIEEETGFNPRTLERWMRDLRRGGYIETQAVPSGIVVRITRAGTWWGGANASKRASRQSRMKCRAGKRCGRSGRCLPTEANRLEGTTEAEEAKEVEEAEERRI
jgi:transposase-like protein